MRNFLLFVVAALLWIGVWFDLNYEFLSPRSVLYWAGHRIAKRKCDYYTSEVVEVRVKWKGRRFSLVRRGDKWIKQEKEREVEVIPYPVEDFLSELLCGKMDRTFEERPEYHIGKDEVTLKMKDGREVRILLGEDVPGGMGRYCKIGKSVGILENHYLHFLDRVKSWEKEEEHGRGGTKGSTGTGKGGAVKTNSSPNGSRGDKETGATRSEANPGTRQE